MLVEHFSTYPTLPSRALWASSLLLSCNHTHHKLPFGKEELVLLLDKCYCLPFRFMSQANTLIDGDLSWIARQDRHWHRQTWDSKSSSSPDSQITFIQITVGITDRVRVLVPSASFLPSGGLGFCNIHGLFSMIFREAATCLSEGVVNVVTHLWLSKFQSFVIVDAGVAQAQLAKE